MRPMPRSTRSTRISRPSSISRSANVKAHRRSANATINVHVRASGRRGHHDHGLLRRFRRRGMHGRDRISERRTMSIPTDSPSMDSPRRRTTSRWAARISMIFRIRRSTGTRRINPERWRAPPLTFPKWCGTTRARTRSTPQYFGSDPITFCNTTTLQRSEQPVHRHIRRR